jgi:1-acyl-sn-glycerol-3-phosphate acyltransferase
MNVQMIKKFSENNVVSDFFLAKNGVKPEVHYTVMKYFARFTQFLSWPIAFVYFNFFFRLRISGQDNLINVRSPFIIISNHVAFYDSFVFRLVLGAFTKKLPLRFMAVNSFKSWYLNLLSKLFIIDIIYIIYGVFVVVKGRGIEKNLEEAVRIIENGGDVVIYPEGSIVHSTEIEPFKLGAAVLAKKTGVPVIPMSMRIIKRPFRNEYIINVGSKMVVDTSLTAEEITETFYEKVKKLHRQVNLPNEVNR